MVPRENKNNAYAKFGGQTKSIMVFSKLAYRDLTQQDCWKTQGGRMTKKMWRETAFSILRDIFSLFCRPKSSNRPVA